MSLVGRKGQGRDANVRWAGAVLGVICATAWTAPTAQAEFEVGQRWQYRHDGPRPGSVEPNAIDGERIVQVLSAVDEPAGTQWTIEERFTRDPRIVARLYVGHDGLLAAIEIGNEKGETARLRYDPPVPYQPLEMKVGETQTVETTLRMDSANFGLPSTTVIERLEDETLVTPAGEFTGCPHYKSTSTSTLDIKIAKIPITEERERWYHPAANGMVKEVYRRGPVKFLGWSRDGYTATSTLTAYGREPVPSASERPTQTLVDSNERSTSPPSSPPASPYGRGSKVALPCALIAAFAIAGLMVRRARRP
jgi:hypothetical protein